MARSGLILTAVRADLRRLKVTRADAPALWALALKLAEQADGTSSARDAPGLSRELRNVLEDLGKVAPPAKLEADPIDQLADARAARLAAAKVVERPTVRVDDGTGGLPAR